MKSSQEPPRETWDLEERTRKSIKHQPSMHRIVKMNMIQKLQEIILLDETKNKKLLIRRMNDHKFSGKNQPIIIKLVKLKFNFNIL